MLRSVSAVLAFAGLLAACASIPNVEYSYYPAKLNMIATVSQTVDCSKDNKLIIMNTPNVETTYSADRRWKVFHVNIKNIEGPVGTFADSDAKFNFSEDGRLQSINQNTTGQGEAVIKAAATLGTTLVSLAKPFSEKTASPCQVIADWGKGKAVNLSYRSKTISSSWKDRSADSLYIGDVYGRTLTLAPTPGSEALYGSLRASLPALYVHISDPLPASSGAQIAANGTGPDDGYVPLSLQTTSTIDVAVKTNTDTLSDDTVTVPQEQSYVLPIPKAALFGKETFALTLSDAGAITSVQYTKNSGAAGALNAANAVAATRTPETRAQQIKAQADLIAQQQRLINCRANPTDCK